jgi:hypothetical protein
MKLVTYYQVALCTFLAIVLAPTRSQAGKEVGNGQAVERIAMLYQCVDSAKKLSESSWFAADFLAGSEDKETLDLVEVVSIEQSFLRIHKLLRSQPDLQLDFLDFYKAVLSDSEAADMAESMKPIEELNYASVKCKALRSTARVSYADDAGFSASVDAKFIAALKEKETLQASLSLVRIWLETLSLNSKNLGRLNRMLHSSQIDSLGGIAVSILFERSANSADR